MSTKTKNSFEDIDEAEEEALLKSDDEGDGAKTNNSQNLVQPPPSVSMTTVLIDDNSLLIDNDLPNETTSRDCKQIDGDDDNLLKEGEMLMSSDIGNEDGSNDDEEDRLKIQKEFEELLKELEFAVPSYDKYVRLVELSYATGQLKNIRKAYSQFIGAYPITAELWDKFIDVELVVAQSPEGIERVWGLYYQGLKDYYSCDLAFKFASFAERCEDTERIWQGILETYGLNCLRGRQFFKYYRQKFANDLSSPEHLKRYINSFLQELRYPLNGMEESYIEFKVYYERNKESLSEHSLVWPEIDQRYFKAKDHLKKILVYEEKLEGLEAKAYRERADVYFEYIRNATKFLDRNVLQTIYERMVADCCLNDQCWLKYIDFLYYSDYKVDVLNLPFFYQSTEDVSRRSLRNCPWSPELYIKLMWVLEKHLRPMTDIKAVLESTFPRRLQTPEAAVSVWLEYLTCLKRNTFFKFEDQCENLRKNFKYCWSALGKLWGVLADCNCEILQFWGRLEYGPLQDPRKGKELWTTVMESSDNSAKSALWIEFALLEVRRSVEGTRNKALHSPSLDNPDAVAAAWERFERCNGSIQNLQNCLEECSLFRQQNRKFDNSFNKPAKTSSSSSSSSSRKLAKKKLPAEENPNHFKKPKLHTSQSQMQTKLSPTKESNFKDHENQEIDLAKDHLRIFLSNLDYNLSEEEIIQNLPEVKIIKLELIRSANGKSRGFGYAEMETEADVEKALTLDRKSINGRPLFVSSVLRDKEHRQKFKYNADKELHKLFIKSLPPDCKQEELENIFGAYGKLKDVRMVYHKSGKFKQIAYVEFENESSASKAVLGTDNMTLRDHNISVAISAPPPKPTTSKSASTNPLKVLGFAPKRKTGELKPRMSLIPNVVRKNLNNNPLSAAEPKAQTGNNVTPAPLKSNEDFRKLLTK